MNEILKTIERRFSCRKYSDKKLSDEDVEAILTAALQSPSAHNLQNWHVTIVRNRELIDELEAEGMKMMLELNDKAAYNRTMERGGKLFYNAQAIAFLATKEAKEDAYKKYCNIDLGILAQNISLASTSLGIDNCHCGMIAYCFKSEKRDEFYKRLGFTNEFSCSYGVLLGYGTVQGIPHRIDTDKGTTIQ